MLQPSVTHPMITVRGGNAVQCSAGRCSSYFTEKPSSPCLKPSSVLSYSTREVAAMLHRLQWRQQHVSHALFSNSCSSSLLHPVKHSARAQVHLQVIVVLPFLLSVHYLLLLTCHGKLDQLLCLLHAAVGPQLSLAMRLLLNQTLRALAPAAESDTEGTRW